METVEMDLMQAQIAELTTEVTRLQRSAGGSGNDVIFNVTGDDQDNLVITCDISRSEATARIKAGGRAIISSPDYFAADYISNNVTVVNNNREQMYGISVIFIADASNDSIRGMLVNYMDTSEGTSLYVDSWFGAFPSE